MTAEKENHWCSTRAQPRLKRLGLWLCACRIRLVAPQRLGSGPVTPPSGQREAGFCLVAKATVRAHLQRLLRHRRRRLHRRSIRPITLWTGECHAIRLHLRTTWPSTVRNPSTRSFYYGTGNRSGTLEGAFSKRVKVTQDKPIFFHSHSLTHSLIHSLCCQVVYGLVRRESHGGWSTGGAHGRSTPVRERNRGRSGLHIGTQTGILQLQHGAERGRAALGSHYQNVAPERASLRCATRCVTGWSCVFVYLYLYVSALTHLVYLSFLDPTTTTTTLLRRLQQRHGMART